MAKKILIVVGSAKYNKGSEILLTGTAILSNIAGADFITISSADIKTNENLLLPYVNKYISRYNDFFDNSICRKIINALYRIPLFKDVIVSFACSKLITEAKNYDLIILVAADNFDYSNKKNFLNSMIHVLRKKTKAKLLLYDFSIHKKNISKYLINDSKKVDFLTARDSLSFKNLKNVNINNILYYPDPAFIVKAEPIEIPNISKKKNYVGVNLSNLIVGKKNELNKYNKIIGAYYKLIENIISKNNLNVLLIPHVMNNADLSILRILHEKYKESGKVILLDNENLNARNLKYIISTCRFFIGARTHATIASYSSCIPTLVLGYSIKSIGIANDLFGTDKNYVIPVDNLEINQLSDGFDWLYDHAEEIQKKLKNMMPAYIKKAESTNELISDMLK